MACSMQRKRRNSRHSGRLPTTCLECCAWTREMPRVLLLSLKSLRRRSRTSPESTSHWGTRMRESAEKQKRQEHAKYFHGFRHRKHNNGVQPCIAGGRPVFQRANCEISTMGNRNSETTADLVTYRG